MSLRDKPHYKLPADTIADWIERQPEKWWSVDGDPLLGSVVDFPCPSDELAPAIRRVCKNLLLRSNSPCMSSPRARYYDRPTGLNGRHKKSESKEDIPAVLGGF